MKFIFTTMLALIVLLQSMSGTLLVVKYQVQKKYIAQKLCENRNNPSKGCAGKCYLKKMLKQAEEDEKALPGNIKEKMETSYVLQIPLLISFDSTIPAISPVYNYKFFVPQAPSIADFQPPQA